MKLHPEVFQFKENEWLLCDLVCISCWNWWPRPGRAWCNQKVNIYFLIAFHVCLFFKKGFYVNNLTKEFSFEGQIFAKDGNIFIVWSITRLARPSLDKIMHVFVLIRSSNQSSTTACFQTYFLFRNINGFTSFITCMYIFLTDWNIFAIRSPVWNPVYKILWSITNTAAAFYFHQRKEQKFQMTENA